MNGLMQALLALMAAMNVATGTPVDSHNSPDRPAIVAPVPASVTTKSSTSSNSTEVVGAIQSVTSNSITVNGVTITLGKNAEVKGTLKVGDVVKVEATKQADGSLLASEVSVSKVGTTTGNDDKNKTTGNDDKGKSNDDKGKGTDDKGKSTDDKGSGDDKSKSGGDDKGSGDDKGKSGGDDKNKK